MAVWVVAVTALACCVLAAVLAVAAAVTARHRAESAADLAALAAAGWLLRDPRAACAEAGRVAAAQGARLESCVSEQSSGADAVRVVVARRAALPGPLADALPEARATARAGPLVVEGAPISYPVPGRDGWALPWGVFR